MSQITVREILSMPKEQQIAYLKFYDITPIQTYKNGIIFKKDKKIGIGRNQANSKVLH